MLIMAVIGRCQVQAFRFMFAIHTFCVPTLLVVEVYDAVVFVLCKKVTGHLFIIIFDINL